jgi:Fe-S-cluster containining protein
MQARGSVLKLLPREELPEGQKGPGIGRTYYELIGDCASLQADGSCGDYDDRPRACRKFPVGGYYCQLLNYAALMAEAALPATEADHTLEA